MARSWFAQPPRTDRFPRGIEASDAVKAEREALRANLCPKEGDGFGQNHQATPGDLGLNNYLLAYATKAAGPPADHAQSVVLRHRDEIEPREAARLGCRLWLLPALLAGRLTRRQTSTA